MSTFQQLGLLCTALQGSEQKYKDLLRKTHIKGLDESVQAEKMAKCGEMSDMF